jgi:putative transposase
MPDHIHMLLSVPPKYRIAAAIRYLEGKTAIRIHRQLSKTRGASFGRSFWARNYFVTTVGIDEIQVDYHIRMQEKLQIASGSDLCP